jgi:hypothetical protein
MLLDGEPAPLSSGNEAAVARLRARIAEID